MGSAILVRKMSTGRGGRLSKSATSFIAFIPGGERREEKGSKCRFRLFFPRSRLLPLLPSNPIRELSIGGAFRSPRTVLLFIDQITAGSWGLDLVPK